MLKPRKSYPLSLGYHQLREPSGRTTSGQGREEGAALGEQDLEGELVEIEGVPPRVVEIGTRSDFF